MKRFLFAITFSLFVFNVHASTFYPPTGEDIRMYWSNPTSLPSLPRMPIEIPEVSLSDHNIIIFDSHQDFMLQLIDEDGNAVFQCCFLSSMSSVVIPESYCGSFELRLVCGSGYFYGYITL